MTSNKKAKLKPCPFCGGKPTMLYDSDECFTEIVCLNINCPITVETNYWIGASAAVAEWNRRAK
jgi:hypothetical protein